MAYTKADLDALDSAIKTGAARVKFQGHETEFRSLDEMLRLRDLIKSEIGDVSPSQGVGVLLMEYGDGK